MVPWLPISLPSYSPWATRMVLATLNPIWRAASCCSLEVMNGGSGCFLLSLAWTSVTVNPALPLCGSTSRTREPSVPFSRSSLPLPEIFQPSSERMAVISPSVVASNDFPSRVSSLAVNDGFSPESSLAFRDQYSLASNARISRSRSQMILRATDCTLPADKPRRTLSHNSGLSLYPISRSRIRRVCWASTRFRSISRGFSNAARIAFLVISLNCTRWKAALDPFRSTS